MDGNAEGSQEQNAKLCLACALVADIDEHHVAKQD